MLQNAANLFEFSETCRGVCNFFEVRRKRSRFPPKFHRKQRIRESNFILLKSLKEVQKIYKCLLPFSDFSENSLKLIGSSAVPHFGWLSRGSCHLRETLGSVRGKCSPSLPRARQSPSASNMSPLPALWEPRISPCPCSRRTESRQPHAPLALPFLSFPPLFLFGITTSGCQGNLRSLVLGRTDGGPHNLGSHFRFGAIPIPNSGNLISNLGNLISMFWDEEPDVKIETEIRVDHTPFYLPQISNFLKFSQFLNFLKTFSNVEDSFTMFW